MTQAKLKCPTTLVLLIEYRRCRCGALYKCPNLRLLAKRPRVPSASGPISVSAYRYEEILPENVPHYSYITKRESLEVTSKIPACPKCFEENNDQLNFFPQPTVPATPTKLFFEPEPEPKPQPAAKPKAAPINLDYF